MRSPYAVTPSAPGLTGPQVCTARCMVSDASARSMSGAAAGVALGEARPALLTSPRGRKARPATPATVAPTTRRRVVRGARLPG